MSNNHSSILQARSSVLLGFTEHCRRHRINPMLMLAKENLSPAVLRSQELLIPYESFVRVLDHAAASSDYPLFSLTLSLRNGIEALGPLGLMASQCDTLASSLDVIQKYLHFHAQGVQLKLKTQGDEASLVYDVQMNPDMNLTQLWELGTARIYSVLRTLAPAGMKITGISFRHSPLAPLAMYVRELGLEPQFNAPENTISFKACYLNKPPSPAPERVRLYFESFMRRVGQTHARPLKHQVIRLIHELIPTGEASADAVARLLGMHTRSLQRQLNSAGTDFRTLLEHVRFQLAQDALSQPDMPLTDVALQLGYSELSAFSRAFKRWSGLSPQQWRAENAAASTTSAAAHSPNST